MSTRAALDEGRLVEMVREMCARARLQARGGESLEAYETSVRAELDAVGLAVMALVMQSGDIDTPEVLINGTRHLKVRRFKDEVHTTFGPAEVEKTSYRKDMQKPAGGGEGEGSWARRGHVHAEDREGPVLAHGSGGA